MRFYFLFFSAFLPIVGTAHGYAADATALAELLNLLQSEQKAVYLSASNEVMFRSSYKPEVALLHGLPQHTISQVLGMPWTCSQTIERKCAGPGEWRYQFFNSLSTARMICHGEQYPCPVLSLHFGADKSVKSAVWHLVLP